jgi:hypothetical protein
LIKTLFSKFRKEGTNPDISKELLEQARKTPNGWVYKIEGIYSEHEFTPPGAIVGAWQVDSYGKIIEESFRPNPNYREDLKGKKFESKEHYEQWCNQKYT